MRPIPVRGCSPCRLLIARGEVAVDEAEGGAVEHEGDAHGSLVPCRDTGTGAGSGRGGRLPQDPQAAHPGGSRTQLSPSPSDGARSPPRLPAPAPTARTVPRLPARTQTLLVQHTHGQTPPHAMHAHPDSSSCNAHAPGPLPVQHTQHQDLPPRNTHTPGPLLVQCTHAGTPPHAIHAQPDPSLCNTCSRTSPCATHATPAPPPPRHAMYRCLDPSSCNTCAVGPLPVQCTHPDPSLCNACNTRTPSRATPACPDSSSCNTHAAGPFSVQHVQDQDLHPCNADIPGPLLVQHTPTPTLCAPIPVSPPCARQLQPLPRVLAIPVLTLEVLTWLMRFSCSGFTSTTTLMFHRDCMATCGPTATVRPPLLLGHTEERVPVPPCRGCQGAGCKVPLGYGPLQKPPPSPRRLPPRAVPLQYPLSPAPQHNESSPKHLVSAELEHPQPPQEPEGHRASPISTTQQRLHPAALRTPRFLPGGTRPP